MERESQVSPAAFMLVDLVVDRSFITRPEVESPDIYTTWSYGQDVFVSVGGGLPSNEFLSEVADAYYPAKEQFEALPISTQKQARSDFMYGDYAAQIELADYSPYLMQEMLLVQFENMRGESAHPQPE